MTRDSKLSVMNSDGDVPPDRVALLLAGGDGKRLNDLTREISGTSIPKQYCRLYNNTSLLEATLARTRLYTLKEKIHVIINRDHIELATDQIPALHKRNVFIQPANRDTGPGIVFSLLKLERMHPNAIVAVFPTDHYIDNDRAFIAHTLRATRLIARMPEKIAILGIVPHQPETGYGYLVPECPVRKCEKTYHVKSFIEKPSLTKAYEIMNLGGLWNTFVMVFKLSRMLDILRQQVPDSFRTMTEPARSSHKAVEIYRNITSWNFSSRVLTRIPQHIIMLEINDVSWSDWGTRESIESTYRALNQVPFWKPSIVSGKGTADRADTTQFMT